MALETDHLNPDTRVDDVLICGKRYKVLNRFLFSSLLPVLVSEAERSDQFYLRTS